jgi:hypothetical protein
VILDGEQNEALRVLLEDRLLKLLRTDSRRLGLLFLLLDHLRNKGLL